MQRNSFNGPLIWSTICIAAVVLTVLLAIPPLAEAAFANSIDVQSTTARFAAVIEMHDAAQDTYAKRFVGRSIFFKPQAPRAAPRAVVHRELAPSKDLTPTEPPRRTRPPYTGPSIKGFVGTLVFFDDALTVTQGEEVNGIEVLSVEDAPHSIKIKYSGWEYDVPFAGKIPSDFFGRSSSARMPGLKQAESREILVPEKPQHPASRTSLGRQAAVPVKPQETEKISRPIKKVEDVPPPP